MYKFTRVHGKRCCDNHAAVLDTPVASWKCCGDDDAVCRTAPSQLSARPLPGRPKAGCINYVQISVIMYSAPINYVQAEDIAPRRICQATFSFILHEFFAIAERTTCFSHPVILSQNTCLRLDILGPVCNRFLYIISLPVHN